MTPKTAFTKAFASLKSQDHIDLEALRQWISAADLKTLGLLHVLIREGWDRIKPSLTMEESCSLDREYFLTCIAKNPRSSDYMDNRYEAAWAMEQWFRHLVSHLPETKEVIIETVSQITNLYRNSKPAVQLAIINGFLEHVFETPSLRSYFEHWKADPEFAEGYKWALMWGKDHETSDII